MTRVAAVDCGTNSFRLLVADVDPDAGTLVDVDRRTEIVRLGQGVDATGRIAPEALERTLGVARSYAALAAEDGVERVRIVATSALRDAANRASFVDGMRALFGVDPEVVTGEAEAALSFRGAVRAVGEQGHHGPYLVVDVGGGSTEVVLGDHEDAEVMARSVDVGSVRLTERHLRSDPPTPAEIERARAEVAAALADVAAALPLSRARTVVGVAGTVTTITAHALHLPAYDSRAVDGAALPLAVVRSACADLLSRSRAGRARLPYLEAGRVDVIGGGALVWTDVLERVHRDTGVTEVITSEHDILDAIAWSLVAG
ncbi:MAG TPA: exopolyphosphatase [Kineosporiaceae bacterium]|nr:exopolyphosphatase [Kineosporiaceae bacterium]